MTLIVVKCPSCSRKYRLPSERSGAHARCKCGTRFRVTEPKRKSNTIDEDTIFGWVMEDADPASQSVLGDTGVLEGSVAGRSAENMLVGEDNVKKFALRSIDDEGAHFEFPAKQLEDPGFCRAFPKQCICSNEKRSLAVHLVVWHDRLNGDDKRRLSGHHQLVGKLRDLASYDKADWIAELAPSVTLPHPFCLPMPFYASTDCKVTDEIKTSVSESATGKLSCVLTISNLEVATKFYRVVAGKNNDSYRKLVTEYERRQKDRWHRLPSNVRKLITTWHQRENGEIFKGYFPDLEAARPDAGRSGLVLTDRRLTFHKASTSRDFAVDEAAKLYVQSDTQQAQIRIAQRGKRDVQFQLSPDIASKLVDQLQKLSSWKISGRLR